MSSGNCSTKNKGQTLIFTRTKRGTQRLAKELVRDGFNAAMIHGDRTQAQRNGALSGFQDGRFQVLVATDIASRGLHVDDVAHVINYDVPKMAEDFIHRVGRTGRAGSQGRASTLAPAPRFWNCGRSSARCNYESNGHRSIPPPENGPSALWRTPWHHGH